MIKWYLITYIDATGKILTSIFALKKKELNEYFEKYRIMSVSKITERQARNFDNWLIGRTELIIEQEVNKEVI